MNTLQFGTIKDASVIAAGCMRIANMRECEADEFIRGALDLGINYFDHADIYGRGASEEIFGKVLAKDINLRSKMYIQSKCGINQGIYDFSKEHIIASVEGSLRRLKTDYIDTLLLHRPDVLMDLFEVEAAFQQLKQQGKVLHFGVSNMNRYQMEYFQSGISENIAANQLQLSIAHTPLIDAGLNVNTNQSAAVMKDAGTLEYCRLHNTVIQAWSPVQHGMFEGVFIGSEKYPLLNQLMQDLASKYHVSVDAIAYAWILRIPHPIQVITGTTKTERLKKAAEATTFTLTRREWYDLYKAAGNLLP